ncbi:MAG: site-2 protease family protein [Planctomycetota bacterium]|jgi:Zn-dependent protease|nr:site-2 protease family protein [Planctomycetota bacterium]
MLAPGAANWSLPIGTLFGIRIRAHWSMLFLALFVVARHLEYNTPWYWLPVLVAVPFASVLLHEFGHSLTARAVGGDSREIIMWFFGGLAMTQVPATPGKRFLVTAMGPVVTLVLAFAAVAAIGAVPPPFGDAGAFYAKASLRFGAIAPLFTAVAVTNTWLLLFNLLPCYPLDGGSMLRSALWPVLGLTKAMVVTIYCAYVVLVLLLIYAFSYADVFMGLLAVMLLFTVTQEHRAIRAGFDPYHGGAIGTGTDRYGQSQTWLERKRAERQRNQASKDAQRQRDLEAELDRLLEKVSTEGLPNLTAKERKFLEAYSKANRS